MHLHLIAIAVSQQSVEQELLGRDANKVHRPDILPKIGLLARVPMLLPYPDFHQLSSDYLVVLTNSWTSLSLSCHC